MKGRSKRLTQLLTRRMIVVQLITLTACFVLVLIPMIVLPAMSGTRNVHPPAPSVMAAIGESVHFGIDRILLLKPTPSLSDMAAEHPDFWFIAGTPDGQEISFGQVPSEPDRIRPALDHLVSLEILMDNNGGTANLVVRSLDYPGGPVKLAFSGGPTLGLSKLIPSISLAVMLAIFFFLALASIIAIPRFINREMSGLDAAAKAAGTINIGQRGIRIPEQGLPAEVLTLVHAVNEALERLDDAHALRERFLADAAHELRTPLAVLTARIETAQPFEGQDHLLSDVVRLSALTTQLLDMQRLDLSEQRLEAVDLVAIGTEVVADLAPLAAAAGYQLELDAPSTPVLILGESVSVERAITNLARNAISHAENRGSIRVKVSENGAVTVSDDGPGIPETDRARIFEPFYRVKPSRSGAGLGLTLVEAIVKKHRGAISVGASATGGAEFAIRFQAWPGKPEISAS